MEIGNDRENKIRMRTNKIPPKPIYIYICAPNTYPNFAAACEIGLGRQDAAPPLSPPQPSPAGCRGRWGCCDRPGNPCPAAGCARAARPLLCPPGSSPPRSSPFPRRRRRRRRRAGLGCWSAPPSTLPLCSGGPLRGGRAFGQ